MIHKKSQAALEFIMTYGWAILVVLVAVGALAYFGVLNPDRFLPSKCTMQAGLACLDHRIGNTAAGGTGRIILRFTNSLGYDIDKLNVAVGECGDTIKTNAIGGVNDLTTFPNGASRTFTIDCDNDGAGANPLVQLSGSKFNEQLNISYLTIETGIRHNNVGQITAKVE